MTDDDVAYVKASFLQPAGSTGLTVEELRPLLSDWTEERFSRMLRADHPDVIQSKETRRDARGGWRAHVVLRLRG